MHRSLVVVPVARSEEQPHAPRRVHGGRSQGPAEEQLPQRHDCVVDVRRRMGDQREDLITELRGDALVRIYLERPFAPRGIQGDVALNRKALPRVFDHGRSGSSRDLDRAVTRAGIHDHELIAERNTGQAVGQTCLFVFHDQTRTQSDGVCAGGGWHLAGHATEAHRSVGRVDQGPAAVPVHSRTVSGLLIVNADDWGASRHTTERIATSFAAGGVSSATAMVYMADSERAAGRALEIGLPTGLHLNLTQAFDGPSVPVRVRETQRHLAARLGKLHRRDRLLLDPRLVAPVRVCVSEQLDCFRSLYGRDPTHLDGHNHVHLDPVVLCVLPRRLRLRTAVRSARIRSPGDLPRMLRHQFIQAVHGTTDFLLFGDRTDPSLRRVRDRALPRVGA